MLRYLQISDYISSVAGQWLQAWQEATATLFNDPDALFEAIDMGKLFHADVDTPPDELFNSMGKTLLASALPIVWATGERKGYPVIA